MLIVNEKYRPIDKIIITESDTVSEDIDNENLTSNGIKALTGILKSNSKVLDDSDVPKYTDNILSFASKKSFDNDNANEFFKAHGIAQFKNEIIQSFVDNKCADALLNIIQNKGIINKDALSEHSGKNIYDSFCDGFKEPAKYIKGLAGQAGNKAEGDYETLLRLILKDGNKPTKGDVGIGNERIEVKKNGGHPYDRSTLHNSTIFSEVDKEFGPSIVDSSEQGSTNYAAQQDKDPIKVFNDRLNIYSKGNRNKRNRIKDVIKNAVATQYHIGRPNTAMDAIADEYNFNKEVTAKEMLTFIGRLQLAAYLDSIDVDGFIILDASGNFLYFDTDKVADMSDKINYTTFPYSRSSRAGAVMQLKK